MADQERPELVLGIHNSHSFACNIQAVVQSMLLEVGHTKIKTIGLDKL